MKKLTAILVIGMMITLTACKNNEPQPTGTEGYVEEEESKTNMEYVPAEEIVEESAEEPDPVEEPVSIAKIDEDMILRYLDGELNAELDLYGNADLGFCCMYEEELDGQTQYLPFHNGMEAIPFETLYDMVKETCDDDITEYPIVSYAIATTKSGIDAMIIRFDGIGTEGGEPTIYSCFVFTLDTERDDPECPFNLVYAFDSWSRHYVEIDDGLIFNGHCSNGAGSSKEWISTIDDNGKYNLVYSLETLDEDWVAMYGEDELNIKYETYDWSRGSHFDIIKTANGSYYSYNADKNVDKDKLDEFIKALKDNGLSETDDANTLKDTMLASADIEISSLNEFDGFKIYGDEGFDDSDIPSSFVEETAGKTSFNSYDELISYLKPGEAYTYVKMFGSDEQILFITEDTIEKDGKVITVLVYPYLKNDSGKIAFGSLIGGPGERKPIAISSDGLVYSCSEDSIEAYCISKENKSIMCKDYLYMGTGDDGKISYSGFHRNENSLDEDNEEWIDTDSDEIYNKLVSEYEKAKPVEFTLVSD